ncbi:MAG: hypothetical protein IKS45_03755 [Thermoguttaceae bacterium]|nr:hypothetical protein [Thermoguttaceae bacterium]
MSVKGVNKAVANLRRQFERVKKETYKNIDQLAKGVFLALSNSPQKVTAKRPTKGGAFSGNRNYKPSSEQFKAFVPIAQGGTDNSQTVQDYIKKLKKEKAGLTTRQAEGEARRKRNQQIRLDGRRLGLKYRIENLEKRLSKQFEKDAKAVANNPVGTYAWKRAKGRMKRTSARLQDALKRAKTNLQKLEQHHKEINKGYAKRRVKPPRRFKFVSRIGGIRGTDNPQFAEVFRVAGFPNPKSWGAGGEFFLREHWRTTNQPGKTVVSISPGKKEFNDTQRFLRQLEDGGSAMGGPLYEGYTVYFKQVGRFTHVTFQRKRKSSKKSVAIKGRHFAQKTVERIKKTLSQKTINKLAWKQWREMGRR